MFRRKTPPEKKKQKAEYDAAMTEIAIGLPVEEPVNIVNRIPNSL
jgi:hypothetical protein